MKATRRPIEVDVVKYEGGPMPEGIPSAGTSHRGRPLLSIHGKSLELSPGCMIVTMPCGERDVLSPDRFAAEYESDSSEPSLVDFVDNRAIPYLAEIGVVTVAQFLNASRADLLAVKYITDKSVDKSVESALLARRD